MTETLTETTTTDTPPPARASYMRKPTELNAALCALLMEVAAIPCACAEIDEGLSKECHTRALLAELRELAKAQYLANQSNGSPASSSCLFPNLSHATNPMTGKKRRSNPTDSSTRVYVSAPCKTCGKKFSASRPNAVFCSDKCRYAHSNQKAGKVPRLADPYCIDCRAPIKGLAMRCDSCRLAHRRKLSAEAKNRTLEIGASAPLPSHLRCQECDGEFTSRFKTTKYCSEKCRKRVYYKQRKQMESVGVKNNGK